MTSFCRRAFQSVEIHQDGSICVCCPAWNKFYMLGNIFEGDFESAWNSEMAIELRTRILNNDYSLCDVENCPALFNKRLDPKSFDSSFPHYEISDGGGYLPIMKEYPKEVKFCYDAECNIVCEMCRDSVYMNSDDLLNKYDSMIETKFLPLLKNAQLVTINAQGDPFASRHSRKLIAAISQKYPDIKYEFHTNASTCTPDILEKLNVTDKIKIMRVSLHAASAKMYGQIVRNGDKIFPVTMKNLEYISQLRKKYSVPFEFYIQFVVMAKNYKEMPRFVELAEKLGAVPVFWEYLNNIGHSENKQADLKSVHLKNHPKHKDFIKTLKHSNMYRGCHLSPLLQKLQQGLI